MNEETPKLIRGLGLADATSLVVGTIIGTGIFLKTTVMTQQVGSPDLVLLVWMAAGLLSLAGALSYAELGGMLPKAGGEYVYLRESYGNFPAFLYGWMRFAIGSTGSIAALGAGFAIFFTALLGINKPFYQTTFNIFGSELPWQFGWSQIVAVTVIMTFSLVNCVGVVFGGKVQTVLTFAKVLGISIIVIGVFLFTKGVNWEVLSDELRSKDLSFIQAFGAAMLAALWAYDGWNNMPMAAGEIVSPEKNVPRALIVGMVVVIGVYLLTNLAYFHALPVSEIATANTTNPVATKAVSTFLGTTGGTFIALAIMISIVGTLNGSILTGARVPYAMAQNGLFPQTLGSLSKSSSVPVISILIQAVWASVLALMGTFDQLTDYAVFAMWIFYILTTSAVFVLRRKMPEALRPYKTLGYPLTPLLFILVGIWLLINTLQTSPLEAGIGLLLISLGIPIYFYFRRKMEKAI
ncbi:MAG TPA: amino acid permease [Pyrinomonadaceae bacterium]|nr:amino acid permease [Pyrinomonadaceae bacterium]